MSAMSTKKTWLVPSLLRWGAWYDLGTWLVNNSYADIIALDK